MPTSLRVVIALLAIEGVLGWMDAGTEVEQQALNLSMLALVIVPGLLLFRPWFHRMALVFVRLSMVLMLLVGLTTSWRPGPAPVHFLGYLLTPDSKVLVTLLAFSLFALSYWQHRVLSRPNIRQLFDKRRAPGIQ